MEEKDYFDFLQIAINDREPLPVCVSDIDWRRLFNFCKRQALLGIGFTAVEKLYRQGVVCPAPLRMQWMASAFQIEKRNEKLNAQCKTLTGQYGHDGVRCCILKGQGNLLNYPEELRARRTPGDIDVWCVAPEEGLPIAVQTGKDSVEYVTYYGRKAVMEYALRGYLLSADSDTLKAKPNIRYHHIEGPDMDGTPVEVHFRVGHINSPLRNHRMQRWFDCQADACMNNMTHLGFSVPTPSVNVVYQMTHLFCHYFDEGLGLRQLMDYYFALKVWHSSQSLVVSDKLSVMETLRSFGMGKFAAAVMWVLHEVFAMPARYYICGPDEKEGRRLLYEIMQGGNFGQHDERGKAWKNGGKMKHGLWKLKRLGRLVRSYPEEALCEPLFRLWHWGWRTVH